ncbi:MAG: chorismate-binding protein [Candidatus Nanopelagicales bacterium]
MVTRVAEPLAYAGGRWASGLQEGSTDPSVLETAGRWLVVLPYSGTPTFLRFADWSLQPPDGAVRGWQGPSAMTWQTSMDVDAYCAAVEETRAEIAAGTVYQANICRVMRASLPTSNRDVAGLHLLLASQNPAPYAAMVRVPELGLAIASASPELFLSRKGEVLTSGPIKGTGRTREDLTDKDRAENVMIVDLVRNDLARVAQVGTVEVPALLREEEHPGLVHLVSHVSSRLLPAATWVDVLDATFPPGSVTGAPKSSALGLIDRLETCSRSFYCGAIGWVDADTQEAELAVAIRTFWIDGDDLCFGTGAGITWGSNAMREWQETELKAQHLVSVASGSWQAHG